MADKHRREERRERDFEDQVQRKIDHKLKMQAQPKEGVWFWLGLMGLVGWSIAVPTLIGIFIGQWLDRSWPGEVSWTLTLLIIGAGSGCVHAWHWVRQELHDDGT